MSMCDPKRVETGLGIPSDINAGMTPFTGNASLKAMQACCAPNEVHRGGFGNCTMWCELSDAFMDGVGEEGSGNHLSGDLMRCLKNQTPDNTTLFITNGQYASIATENTPGTSVRGVVTVLGVLAAMWASS